MKSKQPEPRITLQMHPPSTRCARAVLLMVGVTFLAALPAVPPTWAGGPIVVDENNGEWGFLEEIAGGRGFYSYGPGTPPSGEGSAHLVVDGTGREIVGAALFIGTPLSAITAISFASYRAWPLTGVLAPSFQINIDYDLTDMNEDWQGRLVFEPYQDGANDPQSGVWQTWDALAGNWWSSGSPGNGTCPQGAPCTWAEVLAAFPNAGVHPTLGGILLKAGGPWTDGFLGAVDDLQIVTTAGPFTYDFETANGLFTDGFESGTAMDWDASVP